MRSNGTTGAMSGRSCWRPDATVAELLSAADALERLAADYAGRRHAELRTGVDELRELAWRQGGPEPVRHGTRRFERPQRVATSA
jgi:hypothetical protein